MRGKCGWQLVLQKFVTVATTNDQVRRIVTLRMINQSKCHAVKELNMLRLLQFLQLWSWMLLLCRFRCLLIVPTMTQSTAKVKSGKLDLGIIQQRLSQLRISLRMCTGATVAKQVAVIEITMMWLTTFDKTTIWNHVNLDSLGWDTNHAHDRPW